MFEMTRINNIKACSQADIKYEMDPDWCYVVIKTATKSEINIVLNTVSNLSTEYDSQICIKKILQ